MSEAAAQGAPKPLLPALGAPKPLLPAPAEPAKPAEDPAAAAEQPAQPDVVEELKEGIAVDTLKTVSGESVGIIGADRAALPAEMWNGTPRNTIKRLLALTGESPATKGLRDLLLRVLLSPAVVPEPVEPSDYGTIVEARVGALERLGAWPEYIRMLETAPDVGPNGNESVLTPVRRARLRSDAAFLIGDTDSACAIANEGMLAFPEDRYWQKAGTFCQALAGEWEAVEFNLRLMLELGEEDTRFFELMRAVSGTTSTLPTMPEAAQLRPVDIAMMRVARVAPSMPDPEAVPASLIPVLTKMDAIRFEDRLMLAERGERLGLVDRSELVALYGLVDIDPSQMENALTAAAADPSANGRALLFRAIAGQNIALAKAQAIQQALALARQSGSYAQAARLYAPLILDIPTTSPHAWFAADAAAAFIAAGQSEAAKPWLDMAEREARLSPEAASAWRDAVIMARLAGGEEVPLDEGFLRDWWRGVRTAAPEDAPSRATLLSGLLQATGAETPGTVWRGLIDRAAPVGKVAPPPALSWAMQSAARDGRLGEGAILSALSLSGAELRDFAANHLVEAVQALSDLGLEDDARRLSLDIYLAFAPAPAAPATSE